MVVIQPVGPHRHGAVGLLERDERLRSDHATSSGVYGPRDPAIRLRRRRHEGNGKAPIGVVRPVEGRAQRREVAAVLEKLVVAEFPGSTGLCLRG